MSCTGFTIQKYITEKIDPYKNILNKLYIDEEYDDLLESCFHQLIFPHLYEIAQDLKNNTIPIIVVDGEKIKINSEKKLFNLVDFYQFKNLFSQNINDDFKNILINFFNKKDTNKKSTDEPLEKWTEENFCQKYIKHRIILLIDNLNNVKEEIKKKLKTKYHLLIKNI